MSEPRRNIGFRCEKHKSQPNPVFFDRPHEWFFGKYCKLAFPSDDGKHELMWVHAMETKEIEGETMLFGYLDNDPVLPMEYKCGDGVAFLRNEVHDVCAG